MNQGALDCGYHAFYIAEDVGVWKAQYAVSSIEHEFVAVDVAIGCHVMGVTIQFDNEFMLTAQEVCEKWSDGHLPAELCSELRARKELPKPTFRGRC